MFRMVFPSTIRSPRLYIQYQAYVQSLTADGGRKDHPKHVEWYSIKSKNCASNWFYYRNVGHIHGSRVILCKSLTFSQRCGLELLFWVVTLCHWVICPWHWEGTQCIQLKGFRGSRPMKMKMCYFGTFVTSYLVTYCHIPEDWSSKV